MPKRKTPARRGPAPAGRTRRPAGARPALLAALLLAAVAALALSPGSGGVGVTPSAAAQASPTPSKEYIYAGGRLVATEDYGVTPTPTPTHTPASTPTPTPPPPGQEAVFWANMVGVSASPTTNSLTKTAAAGWNAGAVSTRAVSSGGGYVEFTAGSYAARMCGLSYGDSGQSFADIDFAIYPNAGGLVDIWERGVFVAGGVHSYQPGDRFRVAIEGQGATKYVRYYRIRAGAMSLVHEHQTTPAYPLFADTSLYSTGATVEGAVISGTLSP